MRKVKSNRAILPVLLCLVVVGGVVAALEESVVPLPQQGHSLAELELEQLRLKRDLLQQKLTLLEETRRGWTMTPDLPREGLQSLVNATSQVFLRQQSIDERNFDKSLQTARKER